MVDDGYYIVKGGHCDDRCYVYMLEWVNYILYPIIMIYD